MNATLRGLAEPVQGGFKVVFPHGGQEYEIQPLSSAELACLVCDLLTLKEAVDGQLAVELRSQDLASLTARQLRHAVRTLRGTELSNASFEEVVKQLQACITNAGVLSTVQVSGSACLMYAAATLRHASIVQLLLVTDPQAATAANMYGDLPLHRAAQDGHTDICRLLLDKAPQAATVADEAGDLPLHCAAQAGYTATCQLLLDTAQQAATAANNEGTLPLHWAAQGGHTAVCELLLDKAPQAATIGDNSGKLPLHWAAEEGYTDVCRLLLDKAPQAATAAAHHGTLPLHLAAQEGHTSTCQLLLDSAPQAATAANYQGAVPLHMAAQSGHTAVCEVLLDRAPRAAEIHARNGGLALHVAAWRGHTTTCQLLVDRAPHTATMRTWNGMTPLGLTFDGEVRPSHMDAACCLLAAGPASGVVAALLAAGSKAEPLFGDFVTARLPMTSEEWAALPAPCPGIGQALPAVLAHSADQARQLVQHVPPADVQRLRNAALSLHRAQKQLQVFLPTPIVWQILALSCDD